MESGFVVVWRSFVVFLLLFCFVIFITKMIRGSSCQLESPVTISCVSFPIYGLYMIVSEIIGKIYYKMNSCYSG